ncbi:MAG: extracellular solute-binding protein family 5 [candidate division NC10 bacterium]|nr:extracellular solute-binding protein family 5 [candidate division NC10 bacterium]
MNRKWTLWRGMVIGAALLLAAGGAWAAGQDEPRKGGSLRIAMIGEPPTLDLHWASGTIIYEITGHIYETLFTTDVKYETIPHLAEGFEASDGLKRYVIRLRKGVKFHNGKEMTSADVVASLKRWGKFGTGKAVFKTVETVEARDPYTVEIRLKQPSSVLPTALAQMPNGSAIFPKEVVEAAGDGQIKEYIGTGPFKFVEHKPDRHVRLARFDGYAPRNEAPNGYGGRRTAYVDEILFLPVPDIAIREAGVQTGEYHYAQQLKPDAYERLRKMPEVEPVVIKPYGWAISILNTKQGLMTNKKLRQAFQARLDIEPMMQAAMGHPDFYRLDPGLFFPEQAWHSRAGAELYNQRNKEKARQLLKESGYQGQPIRWMATREYEYHYKPALVSKSQLEEVGFNIDLQVMDWATVVQRRVKPELWDVHSTGMSFSVEATTASQLLCESPGWWCNPEKEALLQELTKESEPQKRRAIVDKVQALFYEDAARMRLGDYFRMDLRRKELRGFEPGPRMHFWNVWLASR